MKTKAFISLTELAHECKCDVADLLYQSGNGSLRLALPFYGRTPNRIIGTESIASVTPEIPELLTGAGVFDLSTEDAIALAAYGQVMVESLVSPCGTWAVSLAQPQLVTSSDVVVRTDEARAFMKNAEPTEPIPDTERSQLLRQIAGMAMLLAYKEKIYKYGDKPNASQIGKAVHDLLSGWPDANIRGLGDTNIRTNISKGVELLTILKE